MRIVATRVLLFVSVIAVLMTAGVATSSAATTAPSAAAPTVSQASAPTLSAARVDYCGGSGASKWVPDHWGLASFRKACKAHDKCYSSSSHTSRKSCDSTMYKGLRSACNHAYWFSPGLLINCHEVALTYYVAVRKFAKSHYHGHGSAA